MIDSGIATEAANVVGIHSVVARDELSGRSDRSPVGVVVIAAKEDGV